MIKQKLLTVAFAVALSMTIGGTASAWSFAKLDFAKFTHGYEKKTVKVSYQPKLVKNLVQVAAWKPVVKAHHTPMKSNNSSWGNKHRWVPWWAKPVPPHTKHDKPPYQPNPTTQVPEPTAALAYGAGLLLMARGIRRRS